MEGLGSLLLFAVFFYLMMRVGCGSHHSHGHHQEVKSAGEKDNNIEHRDPVCGMQVDPLKGYGRMYQERLYRFCSRRCLDKFDEAPDNYLGEIGKPKKLEASK